MNSMNNIFPYLTDLENNNNREWFNANKEVYKKSCAEFEEVLRSLVLAVNKFDVSIPFCDPKSLMFKVTRDIRFSSDKTPYNPSFRAYISSAKKMPIPVGYHIFIQPGDRSFLGGGLAHSGVKGAADRVRSYIISHSLEFSEIITDKEFSAHFSIQGEALKNVPRGYDKNHPQAEYLKNKSWYLQYPVSDNLFSDTDNFVGQAEQIFLLMKPFNDYLNAALSGLEMPTR
ncbi:TIGR02453 family protein [Synergistales bacterium]|nr:TIGR02453 family protein [Synergistales bacterium]